MSSSSLAPSWRRGPAAPRGSRARARCAPPPRPAPSCRSRRRSSPAAASSSAAAVSAASSSTGPVEADIADLELRRVHADRQPAGAGIDVVARQRPLRGGGRTGASRRAPGDAPGSPRPGAGRPARRRECRSSARRAWAPPPYASSGPARAKMRAASSTAGRGPRSMRMKLRGADAPGFSSHVVMPPMPVGHIQDHALRRRSQRTR